MRDLESSEMRGLRPAHATPHAQRSALSAQDAPTTAARPGRRAGVEDFRAASITLQTR